MSTPAPNEPHTQANAEAEAARLIAAAYAPDPHTPLTTANRDTTPVPAHGDSPPVHQPDRRVVPEWAAGVAVAGIGLGCFAALTGVGIYVATAGLAQLTIWGVAAIAVPFVGISAVAIAIGTVIRHVRTAAPPTTHHHYRGAVTQHHQSITTRGAIARTRIQQ